MTINNKKILLIEPPLYKLYKETFSFNMLPLSLGYLGASIKKIRTGILYYIMQISMLYVKVIV